MHLLPVGAKKMEKAGQILFLMAPFLLYFIFTKWRGNKYGTCIKYFYDQS